ncbi:MAG: hypothetical protein IPL32_17465 [Chloracidobacterium sp.]|nr:hypothetical protein [Chloracidobacterium sp.]
MKGIQDRVDVLLQTLVQMSVKRIYDTVKQKHVSGLRGVERRTDALTRTRRNTKITALAVLRYALIGKAHSNAS